MRCLIIKQNTHIQPLFTKPKIWTRPKFWIVPFVWQPKKLTLVNTRPSSTLTEVKKLGRPREHVRPPMLCSASSADWAKTCQDGSCLPGHLSASLLVEKVASIHIHIHMLVSVSCKSMARQTDSNPGRTQVAQLLASGLQLGSAFEGLSYPLPPKKSLFMCLR